jgi:hypothetical protein
LYTPCQNPFLYIGIFLFGSRQGNAQSTNTDSLRALLQNAKDTTRVNVLDKLSKAYWYIDPVKTIEYAAASIELAEKLGYTKGITTTCSYDSGCS